MKLRNEEFYEAFDIFGEGDVPVFQKLSAAVQSAMSWLPDKGRREPGWFQQHADTIQPVVDKRNTLAHSYFTKPTDDSRRAFTDARKEVKNAVTAAKNAWVISICEKVDTIAGMGDGGHLALACWPAIDQLRRGLSRVRKIAVVRMTKADGTKSTSDQEDADAHEAHYKQLYGKAEEGSLSKN